MIFPTSVCNNTDSDVGFVIMKKQNPAKTDSTRRKFLKYGAGFGAALAWPNSKVIGANDDIRVGVVGVKGRGQAHIKGYVNAKGARVVALCDVDPMYLDARSTLLAAQQKMKVESFSDMREMFEKGDIDAFSTATPNHWHSLAGIWAMQAGKDAYVEKPVSHNVWEGRQLVKTARKYKRICQGGTQSRSIEQIANGVAYVKSGAIGKILWAKGTCYNPRPSIGLVGSGGGEIPAGLDYDLWSGPAPMQKPLKRENLHYDWHWIYAYGNGDMGNQGIHQMDVARWFLGEKKLSPRVMSIGGRLGYKDDGETPNTQIVYHDYEAAPLIFETRGLPHDKAAQAGGKSGWGKNMDRPEEFPEENGVGMVIQCEGGRVYCGRSKVKVTDNQGKEITKIEGSTSSGGHFNNFIEAVRSRKTSDLFADCEETHISSALCHTGLISHQLGQQMHDSEVREAIKSDSLLAGRYAAMEEHLRLNDVDLGKENISLGPWLKFNPDSEQFEGNDGGLDAKANKLATREYRAPYIVPEKV